MASKLRNIEKRILREKGLMPDRHKAIRSKVGQPFRNCNVNIDEKGNVTWTRYH